MNKQNAKLKSVPTNTKPLKSAGVLFKGFPLEINDRETMKKWRNE